MGLGILEDRHLDHVPGTSLFNDDPNAAALSAYEGFDLNQLKHGKGRNAHIVLVPQPSDDPNDPLNWPQWKKHTVLFVVVYGTTICGALGPLVSADQVGIAADFDRSVQAISRALGSALALSLAFSTVAWSVVSIKIGKRPVFLASSLAMFAGAMLSAYASTYNILLGSRILQGVGQSVLEFLAGATISDIYFVHERGVPVALWNLALLDGINVTPPIAGQIIETLGWKWCFKFFCISVGVLFGLQFFLMPETTYSRGTPITKLAVADVKDGDIEKGKEERSSTSEIAVPSAVLAKKSFREELAIYQGVRANTPSVVTLLIRPILACFTPVCLWASLVYGVAITWLVLISTGVAQLFTAPPYNFSAADVGLTYMSPFVYCLVAAFMCGPLTDWTAKIMSKANKGIFEPEFRLLLVFFYFFFGTMGFFGWGISANVLDPWIGPVMFFGIINFGITIGCSASIGYVVDAHRQSADSALGAVIFFKNIFSFIITLFINDWFAVRGVLNVFSVVGGVTIATTLLTIPMYIYGKRARSWIHRTLRFDDDEVMVVAH